MSPQPTPHISSSTLPLNTTAPPARSTTAPTAPTVKPKHHIPHHPHHISHRHHHHHHHGRDKSVPQSAIQLSSSNPFSQILSPLIGGKDGKGDDAAQGHSRSPSAVAQDSRARIKEEDEERRKERDREVWVEIERRREGRVRGEGELHRTLTSLSTLSTSTTRRLDYTYYSLLSHLSALTATISDLRALSSTTAHLAQTFSTESNDITQEVSHQISAFEDFEAQRIRIKALQERMEKGRRSVGALGERLERVKGKVEACDRAEEEWKARMGRRVRWLWGSSCTVLGVVVLVLVIQHWPRAKEVVVLPVVGLGNLTVSGNVTLPAVKSVASGRKEGGRIGGSRTGRVDVDDHPALRLLDEL